MTSNDLDRWEQYSDKISELKTAYGPDRPELLEKGFIAHMMFRGHPDSNWKLETTLERYSSKVWTIEKYMRKVASSVSQFESFTGRQWNIPDWPAIQKELQAEYRETYPHLPHYNYCVYLRHHGYPSPLLDWTQSPFVAAYFAFSETEKGADRVAVWMYVDTTTGTKEGFVAAPAIHLQGPNVAAHKRHFLQQSVYTLASKPENNDHTLVPHEAVKRPDDQSQDVLVKITIPVTERIAALKSLNEMNINHYSLFQTEDALAKTLAQQQILFPDAWS